MRRLLLALLAGAMLAASAAGVAPAATPRIVIFSGKPLSQQVAIADWDELFAIFVGPGGVVQGRSVSRAKLRGRPWLTISMFWGPRWSGYLDDGRPATALRPSQADSQGAFYPAWRGRPALIDLPWAGRWPRPVSAAALRILARHGVPVRLPSCRPRAGTTC